MKKIFRISLIILIALITFATSEGYSQDKKLTRKERKELRKAELTKKFKVLDRIIEDQNFVLKADFLENKYGNRVQVSPLLNFVQVNPDQVVFQVGSPAGIGYNGVGGITAEGNLDRYKVYKNEKSLSFDVNFTTITNIGAYDIRMSVSADGYARATISGLRSGNITYSGYLIPTEQSDVFKGQRTL